MAEGRGKILGGHDIMLRVIEMIKTMKSLPYKRFEGSQGHRHELSIACFLIVINSFFFN